MSFASTRLKRVARVVAGQAPSSDAVSDNGAMPFIQGCAEFGASNPLADKFCDHAPKHADKGDWLISVRAPVGRLNIADQRYGIGRGLAAVKPERINGRFLGYAITHAAPKLSSVATGSTYEAVSGSDIGNMLVPLPDLDTQKAIADFLDKETARIDQLIEKKQRLVELLGEKRSAHQGLLMGGCSQTEAISSDVADAPWLKSLPDDWNVRRMRSLVRISTGSRDTQDASEGGKYRFYVRSPIIRSIDSYSYDETAVLTSGDGAGVGSVFHYVEGKFELHQRMYAFTRFTGVQPKFFYFQLRAFFKHQMKRWSAKSTVDSVRMPFLKSMPFAVPTLEMQGELVEQMEKIEAAVDQLTDRTQTSIDRLKEYRSALITAAVTGQIDVTRWGQAGEGDKRLDQIQEEMAG